VMKKTEAHGDMGGKVFFETKPLQEEAVRD
jgi:hypothetical protein